MFKGQYVLLRATTRDDMHRQWEFENDKELFFWDGGKPRPLALEKMLQFYDEMLKSDSTDVSFSIEVEGKYIGHCGLHNLDQVAHACELGIEIGDRACQGKGYGRDTVRLLLDYAFRHMNLNRVWLETHSENERAIRCYRACGFIEEGRLRQAIWIDGRYVDRVVMGILRHEALEILQAVK
jgi:RimJ/RimL family protein N-acetyltransferase